MKANSVIQLMALSSEVLGLTANSIKLVSLLLLLEIELSNLGHIITSWQGDRVSCVDCDSVVWCFMVNINYVG